VVPASSSQGHSTNSIDQSLLPLYGVRRRTIITQLPNETQTHHHSMYATSPPPRKYIPFKRRPPISPSILSSLPRVRWCTKYPRRASHAACARFRLRRSRYHQPTTTELIPQNLDSLLLRQQSHTLALIAKLRQLELTLDNLITQYFEEPSRDSNVSLPSGRPSTTHNHNPDVHRISSPSAAQGRRSSSPH
jgi:hypothetical protein